MHLPKLQFRIPRLSITEWWLVSLVCLVAIGLALTAYDALLFVRAFRADTINATDVPKVESVSRESLRETIERFNARIQRFENITAGYGGLPDAPAPTETATSSEQ